MNEETELTAEQKRANAARIENGRKMVEAVIDFDESDPLSGIVDAVADILHFALSLGDDPENVARIALGHVEAEIAGED